MTIQSGLYEMELDDGNVLVQAVWLENPRWSERFLQETHVGLQVVNGEGKFICLFDADYNEIKNESGAVIKRNCPAAQQIISNVNELKLLDLLDKRHVLADGSPSKDYCEKCLQSVDEDMDDECPGKPAWRE